MSTVNMKVIQGLVDTAQKAFDAWKVAGAFALGQHHGYSAALQTNAAARAAAEELRGYCNTTLTQLHSDPATDPGWFTKIGAIRDDAIYKVQTLDSAKALLEQDLAAHISFLFPPAEAAKYQGLANQGRTADAAAAVDQKYKGRTPNAKDPSAQDTSAPPVDVPPEPPTSNLMWAGLAALGLAGLWIARRVMR